MISFLTAKKFAMDDKASSLSINYIKEAVSTLEFIDLEVKELLYDYLKVEQLCEALRNEDPNFLKILGNTYRCLETKDIKPFFYQRYDSDWKKTKN